MTVTYVTKQSNPSATTETTLYTVPTVSVSKIVTITVCNQGVAGSFRISRSVGGGATAAKDYLFYDAPIAASGTAPYVITTPFFTNTADKIKVYASHANMSFQLDAQETT